MDHPNMNTNTTRDTSWTKAKIHTNVLTEMGCVNPLEG